MTTEAEHIAAGTAEHNRAYADGAGWMKIGQTDKTGRRSFWYRVLPLNYGSGPTQPIEVAATSIEMCAGREGDDAFVSVSRDNPIFAALLDVLLAAEFAGDTGNCPDPECVDCAPAKDPAFAVDRSTGPILAGTFFDGPDPRVIPDT